LLLLLLLLLLVLVLVLLLLNLLFLNKNYCWVPPAWPALFVIIPA
jgi:steroid 5-alpha reductase family enzyme